jgi:hypothetical protein
VFTGASCKAGEFGEEFMAFQEIVVDEEGFIAEDKTMAEAVGGLTCMMHADGDAGLARVYARQLDAQVAMLEVLMRSDNPTARYVCARLWN